MKRCRTDNEYIMAMMTMAVAMRMAVVTIMTVSIVVDVRVGDCVENFVQGVCCRRLYTHSTRVQLAAILGDTC